MNNNNQDAGGSNSHSPGDGHPPENASKQEPATAPQKTKGGGHRRNIILIRPRYQNTVGLYTGIMAVLALLIGVGSFVLLPLLVGAFSKQRTYIPTKILDMLMLSFPWLILGVGLIFAFAVFAGIYYSHRVAGPLHKIESILQERLSGKPIGMIRLRPKDQLHELAQLLNDVFLSDAQVEATATEMVAVIETIFKDISSNTTITYGGKGIEISTEQLLLLTECNLQLKEALRRQEHKKKHQEDTEKSNGK